MIAEENCSILIEGFLKTLTHLMLSTVSYQEEVMSLLFNKFTQVLKRLLLTSIFHFYVGDYYISIYWKAQLSQIGSDRNFGSGFG